MQTKTTTQNIVNNSTNAHAWYENLFHHYYLVSHIDCLWKYSSVLDHMPNCKVTVTIQRNFTLQNTCWSIRCNWRWEQTHALQQPSNVSQFASNSFWHDYTRDAQSATDVRSILIHTLRSPINSTLAKSWHLKKSNNITDPVEAQLKWNAIKAKKYTKLYSIH